MYDEQVFRVSCFVARVLKLFVIALFLFGVWNSLWAKPLRIEITGSKLSGVPFAVTNFTESHDLDISDIVRQDLQNSGQFQLKSRENVDDHEYWRAIGADILVQGNILQTDMDDFDVSFQLIDLYKKTNPVILSYVFSKQQKKKFRALAHHISDLVFEKTTGVKGFFSTHIAYITVEHTKNHTIHTLTVSDTDGENDIALLSAQYPLMSPSWSPDGKKIVFVSFKDNRASIKTIDIASGAIDNVTNFPGINGAPKWSPDGSKLALVLSKDGAPKIYTLDLATKKLDRLTHGGAIDTEPFWHPSGKSLVFTSNRSGRPQIYQVGLEDQNVTKITYEGDYNSTPSITPDGRNLLMLHRNENGNFNIAVQDLTSGRLRKLTNAQADESPTLAPNGMMVLYGARESQNNILSAVTLDGKFNMRLPVQDANVKEPAWSPFSH